MTQARRAALLLAAVSLAACSSGSSSPPPKFSISGTVRALAATAADGDTNDPAAPIVHNDDPTSAQAIPSAVTLGGWASVTDDPQDWYRVTLAAGQVVSLRIADWTSGGENDLDLCIYTAAASPARVTCSAGTGQAEAWTASSAGTYLVEVLASSGASSYVLTIGQAPHAVAAGALRLDAEFVPGEVLVRFKDGASARSAVSGRPDAAASARPERVEGRSSAGTAGSATGLAARAASLGLEPLGGDEGREMRLSLGAGRARDGAFARLGITPRLRDAAAEALDPLAAARSDTIELVKALRRRDDVQSADPNYIFHPTLVPNDPHWVDQWNLPMMSLPAAWDTTTGMPPTGDVIVAVIDTGVYLAHPDLSGKLVAGYDFISNPTMSNDGDGIDPNPDDPGDNADITKAVFHGTHVAGIVGAATNNGTGIAGVSWGAKIMPIRAIGIGGGLSSDINEGLRYAARLSNASGTLPAQRADVVNLSLGCTSCYSDTDRAVVDAVRAAGVVIVAAAGNDGTTDLSYPASYKGVLSVAAVGPTGTVASYSNHNAAVGVAAPGGDVAAGSTTCGAGCVLSTYVAASSGTRVYAYAQGAGTSMAAPHVAGAVALMKAVCPTLSPDQVDAFLVQGLITDEKGTAGWDAFYGWGLLNAKRAVNAASSYCTSSPPALRVSPASLELGPSATSVTLTPSIVGATLSGAVAASDDATWLALASPGGDGLGAWTATVTRGTLPAGVYSATVTFSATLSPGGAVTVGVPVTMEVGGATATGGSVGYLHVQAIDASSHVAAEVRVSPAASGAYAYALQDLPAGSYTVRASTDMDHDLSLCDAGEACGMYPTRAGAAPVSVSANTSGIDFTIGFDSALGAAGTAGIAGAAGAAGAAAGAGGAAAPATVSSGSLP